ncbi:MAG: WG repeat-containing protein [Clostridiales bacterium]|nr:WG repeat-containing protein [Clostridiales bacterium]
MDINANQWECIEEIVKEREDGIDYTMRIRIVHLKGKIGVIDSYNGIIVEPELDYIGPFVYSKVVRKDNFWKSEEKIKYALIMKDNKYGYINELGEIMVEPIWDNISAFVNQTYAYVTKLGKYGLIDMTGKVLIEPSYDYIGQCFGSKYFWVRDSGKYGLITSERIIVEPKFEMVRPFKDGKSMVFLNGQWSYMDSSGNLSYL